MEFLLICGAVVAAGLIYKYREQIKKTLKVSYEEITGRDWD